jgi:hypothetical protein
MQALDLKDKVFGNWTVLKRYGSLNNKATWICKCSCGKEKIVIGSNLKNGISKSCGCSLNTETHTKLIKDRWNKKEKIKTGDIYGRLTVIEKSDKRKDRCKLWLCKCSCGKIILTTSSKLTSGKKKSCGCLIIDTARKLKSSLIGKLNPRWRYDLTDEDREVNKLRIYNKNFELIQWRKLVFQRDNFVCNICGKNGGVNAHHKDSWDLSKDRRYDLSNGITLCRSCHKKFHMFYGWGKNTEAQYNEFQKTNSIFHQE